MSRIRTSGTDIETRLSDCVKSFWSTEHYRKNVKNLPGKPDIVFPKSKIAVFADGDFWHGRNFEKWRKDIPKFWRDKIASNIKRDKQQAKILERSGYRVLRFWGSDIKGSSEKIILKIGKILTP